MHEETLSTSYLYRGRIINVRQDRVVISGGQVAFREIIEHPGAVAMLVLDGKGGIVLVKQHRQPVGQILLEIPAGKLEPNEEPLRCARRELLEETGLEGNKWQQLFSFYPSPGFCDEIIYMFQVEELSKAVTPSADPDERISVVTVPLAETPEMIKSGQIKDGKTIIALQEAMLQGI